MINRFMHVFMNTDMRNQHDGLYRMALKKKVDLNKLSPGEHVLFVNANLNKLKIYSPDGTPDGLLSYKRSSAGLLNMGMIEHVPSCMGSDGKINWDKAEKLALQSQLDRALATGSRKKKAKTQ